MIARRVQLVLRDIHVLIATASSNDETRTMGAVRYSGVS